MRRCAKIYFQNIYETFKSSSGNLRNLSIWILFSKMNKNGLEAQVHFSITLQLLSSSFDSKKTNLKKNIFPKKLLEALKGMFSQNSNIHFTLAMRVDSICLTREFPHGTQLRSLLVHQNPRLVYAKLHCRPHAQVYIISHVRHPHQS